uniref:Transmembrane protein 135 N-terminal domain-containing protein n=1 Tax=Stomoxys calcitrans TaxID=35570 RepID=A0A1I8PZ00_STOCA
MVTFSKFFEEHIKTKSCADISLHRGSCLENCVKILPLILASNLKYFAPICLLPLLTKATKLDKEKLRFALEYYVESSFLGSMLGYTISCLVCLFKNLRGQFGPYTFVFIPTLIAGSLVHFTGAQHATEVFETCVFQSNIEMFLITRRFVLSRLIADSKLLQTYLFMLCSALILQGKYLYNLKGFWPLTPNPKLNEIENQEHNKCQLHSNESCQKYLLHGMRKYLIVGLALDIVKALLSKVDEAKTQNKLWGKIYNFRIRSTALLTTYIGIYRFAHCFLNRYSPNGNILNHFMAAFLAGGCYGFYPQSNLFSYALIQTLRTIWSIIKIENYNTNNKYLRLLFRLPYGRIMYPLALAYIVHLSCFKPDYCSKLTVTFINAVTNNRQTHVHKEFKALKQIFKNDVM